MPDPTELTEITAMEPDELHLVGRGANGFPQLLAKELAGEVAAELDAETDEADYLAKAAEKYTAEQITALGKKGHAFKNPDGSYSYPIDDADDLARAIKAVGRGKKASHDAIRKYVAGRAKAMGKSDEVPETWGADGSLSKEAAMKECPTCKGKKTIKDGNMECPDCKGKGEVSEAVAEKLAKDDGAMVDQSDATIPGSAAWETADAAALIEAGQMLASAASMLTNSANRERIEVATGHADDMADVYDLSDAVYAVQNALSIVARVAFTEEAEAQSAGAMAKQISPETVEAVRQTVEVLTKALDDGAITGAAGEGGDAMSIEVTTEELGTLIATGVTEALAKERETAASETDAATAEAEKLAKETAESGTGAETGTETPEPTMAEMFKSLQDSNKEAVQEAVASAVAPLQEQVEELSKAARPGGPRVSVPGTGRSEHAGTGEVDITELEEQFAKAVAGSTEKADLGERITKMRLLNEYGIPVKSNA